MLPAQTRIIGYTIGKFPSLNKMNSLTLTVYDLLLFLFITLQLAQLVFRNDSFQWQLRLDD